MGKPKRIPARAAREGLVRTETLLWGGRGGRKSPSKRFGERFHNARKQTGLSKASLLGGGEKEGGKELKLGLKTTFNGLCMGMLKGRGSKRNPAENDHKVPGWTSTPKEIKEKNKTKTNIKGGMCTRALSKKGQGAVSWGGVVCPKKMRATLVGKENSYTAWGGGKDATPR